MAWLRHAPWAIAIAAVAGCIASAPTGIERITDGTGGAGGDDFGTANVTSATTGPDDGDPHGLYSADPPHGPFAGGTRVVIKGKGFSPGLRLWFGEDEAADVVAIDPTRAQVYAPPHPPGEVELVAQNGDDASTRRVLPAGYSYDALYASPDEGPVAGGTVIQIFGTLTTWDTDLVEARVDQKPCTTTVAVSATELSCMVPKGTPGAKSISVVTSEGTTSALDAFTYQDSSDGFKGGLSGAPLAGKIRVLAFDNFSGDPLVGAAVIVGDDIDTALLGTIDDTGVVEISDPSLTDPVTVTVAATCHSPITFAAVPVDTVTTYLDPVLTPQCAGEGDPPPGGGNPVVGGIVVGELVWPSIQEFKKGNWDNVPAPGPNEERLAYVYYATRNPNAVFQLQSQTYVVDEEDEGDIGYGFTIPGYPGSQDLYALAGLFDKSNGKFSAYAFGAVTGVAVFPGQTTQHVIISMDHALDQKLTLQVGTPPPGNGGPDRLDASVVVELAPRRYAILPNMKKTPFLPLFGNVSFIGLPPLDKDLTGMRYVASAAAATGPTLTAPLSVVGAVAATTTAFPIDVSGFVAIPQLVAPATGGGWNGTQLTVAYPGGGFPADVTVYEITAAGGLWRWIVAVPAGAVSEPSQSVQVPDLSGFPEAHLPPGPIVIGVYGARYDDLDYGKIAYRNLRPVGMSAYAYDFFPAHLLANP
jgi:hypothetical protein